MEYIQNFLIERGFSLAFAASYIYAIYGTLLMVTIIVIHKGYLVFQAINEIPEKELTEDKRDITIKQLIDKYLCIKRIGLVCCLSYLILFAANYIFISRL